MEKYITYIVIILLLGGGFFLFFTCEYFQDFHAKSRVDEVVNDFVVVQELRKSIDVPVDSNDRVLAKTDDISTPERVSLYSAERITKKPFGIFVSPQNSLVQPERFRGYHTGTDFEVFDDEYDIDVVVTAVCDGPVVMTQRVGGYGGVLVQECFFDDQITRVLYGHLDLSSIVPMQGNTLYVDDIIGVLGAHESIQTDGERKHLHLSIHKGQNNDVRGYVQSKNMLDQWIDPCSVLSCTK